MTIRYLILALTTRCNLSCGYCYNGESGAPEDMTDDVMDAALDVAAEGRAPLHVQLTGGEPTLVPETVGRAVRRVRKRARNATIGLQTNGTRLSPSLVGWLRDRDVQIGVSLDGPPGVHQALRGRASETLLGLRTLESEGVSFRVTTVVCAATAGHLDRLVLLLAGFRQARGVGLDLLVRKGRGRDGVAPAGAVGLGNGVRAMTAALDAVNRRRETPIRLRERDHLRRAMASDGPPQPFCHACRGESLAVRPDGALFPCGQTLGDARFAAGTVYRPDPDRLMGLAARAEVGGDCAGCPLAGRCPGECPSRLFYNRAADPGLGCHLYRTLWESEEATAC